MLRLPRWTVLAPALFATYCCFNVLQAAELKDAEWIWSPKFKKLAATSEAVYFRKRFDLSKPAAAKIEITCDNIYTLYVNGEKLAEDSDWTSVDEHDVSRLLVDGSNVIAIRGGNEGNGAAGLVAKLTVTGDNKTTTIVTDATWKTALNAPKGFERPDFNDNGWEGAVSFGKFGQTEPWAGRRRGRAQRAAGQFAPLPGFAVEEIITPGSAGSIVAMAFDEDGGIIASREGGPLVSIHDTDGDGKFESIAAFCDKVKNCQGILPLDGAVYAVGDGPDGTAFYRLTKSPASEQADQVDTLFKFRGSMGEHGPHQPVLGPDGLIYLIIGNHAGMQSPVAESSPFQRYYEGDLIEPKYEDANGHAVGIKSPCGTVIRTDRDGKRVELYCGGFRNSYDIAFNRDGELFTYDSDMEWDVGLPWYRPTRLYHLIPSAEFGSRSGWSPWPEYYPDVLPATLDTGRGSPTGIEFYNHTRYPEKYHGALFLCDWSQGRILAVGMKSQGGSYTGESETFLEGRPLNCSDIAVGPDGWLYICVGGRGTQGSILRVVSTDAKPLAPPPDDPIVRLVRQPQLSAAWSRKQIVQAKQQLGERFGRDLLAVARNSRAPVADRVQALELLEVYGPQPSTESLTELARSEEPKVRGRAIYLLGVHGTEAAHDLIIAGLGDRDDAVRRLACEALTRSGQRAPVEKLLPLLIESDRFVAWSARRVLEQLPKTQWESAVLSTSDVAPFVRGAISLMVLDSDRDTVRQVIDRTTMLLADKRLSDDQRLDVLRIAELALCRSRMEGEDVPGLREAISRLYPAEDSRINRELVRLLVYLQDPSLAPRLVSQLKSEIPLPEKIHAGMYARFLRAGWTPQLGEELVQFYEVARKQEGGNSFKGYLTNAARDFLKSASAAEQLRQIADGAKAPGVTLALVQALSKTPSADELAAVRKLDREVATDKTDQGRDLAKAILVVLARGDEQSRGYLRQVFESSPDRRGDVAAALSTQVPAEALTEPDWQLLGKSLSVVEGPAARAILQALLKSPQRTSDAALLRQVILQGLKLQDQGGQEAAALLEHWTGVKQQGSALETTLSSWQDWYRQQYPGAPDPVLPVDSSVNKYTFAELTEFLNSDKGSQGSTERGAAVFEKALCIKCHRYGTRGEGIGPDLTNVSSRFQRKEILESVLFPSQVISDQFAAKTVLTTDGKTYSGLVGPSGDGIVVLQATAEKVTIANGDIDMIVPSKKSAMPEGLFATLSLEEIADLFTYLGKPPAAP